MHTASPPRKTCKQCAQHLPMSDFYKHENNTDGHLGKCKACVKMNVANNRRLKAAYYRAYELARYDRNLARSMRAAARRAQLPQHVVDVESALANRVA